MFAIYADKPDFDNPLSALVIGERPEPKLLDGWIRVKVSAVALNWHDLWTLRGMGMRPIAFPMILGCDGAGTLDDGAEILIYPLMGNPDWKEDETIDPDRNVFSELHPGTMADYAFVPRRNIIVRPKELTQVEGAALGTAWLTAYRMLFTRSNLRAGQTMLVQGASGGVSTALIQLGNAAGMNVWATGRTEEKQKLARNLGAQRTFAPGEKLPEKVDAVFDTVGAATWKHSLHSVRTGGTIVTCGAHTGRDPSAELGQLFREQISVHGSYLGTLHEFRNLLTFVTTHGFRPQIGEILPMEKAEKGFRDMWEGRTAGKFVFTR